MSQVPENQRAETLEEVGELVVDEILRKVGSGNSPVDGYGSFQTLNKEYAKREKKGNRTPNLDLTGSMLDSLEFKIDGDSIEVGIFADSGEVDKADGHNNFSGLSDLPLRRFIPAAGEEFTQDIERKIRKVVENKRRPVDPAPSITGDDQAPDTTVGISVEDILGPTAFQRLFGGES